MENIIFDLNKVSGKVNYMNAVNNGPTNPGVRGTGGNFLLYKEAGISYARNHDASFYNGYGGEHTVDVHRIFKNFDADENDPSSYIFEPTDKYVLNTINAGTKVFYRLGASIEHHYKYGTCPPKDFEKWARICEHIIMHYNKGWANGYELGIDYWEIWNEPDCKNLDGSNPCWQGTDEEFVDLYCTVSRYLKDRFPEIKIGGPAFSTIWVSKDFVEKFLAGASERKAPLDFFSFHTYTTRISDFKETIELVREMTNSYGFSDTELILNEWNYMKSFVGEEFTYSLEMIKGVKGSAFVSSAMAQCQRSGLDMLMYYDARPCAYNGLFTSGEKLKSFYSYIMFKHLLELGTYISTSDNAQDIYTCAAKNDKESAIMLSYYNDDDNSPAKEFSLECQNMGDCVKAEHYILDKNNDMSLIREEIFTTGQFKLYLKLGLFTTYFIKFTKISDECGD